MFSNLEEIKARKVQYLQLPQKEMKNFVIGKRCFYIPKTIEPLEPFLTVVPLQLMAYYIGTKRGLMWTNRETWQNL